MKLFPQTRHATMQLLSQQYCSPGCLKHEYAKFCSASEKNPYPPHRRSSETPMGRGGVLKAKILEAKYEAKLEFPGGNGVQN